MFSEDPHDHMLSRTRMSGAPWQTMAPQAQGVQGVHVRAEEGVDLAQLWGMVRDNWKLVFSIGGALFLVVMIHCLRSPMSFVSVARMYMGESDATGQSALDISTGSSEANGEIEVLRSRAMVRKGVLGSGYNVSISPPDWKPPVYWQWLLSHRDPRLLDVAGDLVTATVTTLNDDVIHPRKYSVKFESANEYQVTDALNRTFRGELGTALRLPEGTMTLVRGRKGPTPGLLLDVVVDPTEDAVASALTQLTVSAPKAGADQAKVLALEFACANRRLAVSFLDHLMRGYLETRLEWKTEDASAAESFVSDQLQTLRGSLDVTLSKLADYRTENRVVIMENEAQATAAQVNRYEEQRIAAQLELNGLRQIQKALQNPSSPVEAYMVGEASDAVLQRMAGSLAEARQKLSVLNTDFSGTAPDVKRQEAQVQAQLTAIRHYVDGRAQRADKQLAALNAVIGRSEAKLKSVPGAELALAQMGRETEVYNRMYNYLLERKQQAAITKASTVSKNRILDRPYVPLLEATPKLGLHLASGIIGLLLGAAVAILRGVFSAVVRRENDVRGVLGPLQLIARIPTRARNRADEAGFITPVFDVLGGAVDPGFSEAFRGLRTNLYRALPGEHGKVIMITSPGPGDGKTTCALSLAAMLAADNRRVLVIDADVRNPAHHELFGIPAEPGLQDVVMQGQDRRRNAIRTLCLSSGSFDALCAGNAPSAELLSDPQFVAFLVQARSQYDFVVLDAPSYPTVSDPLVLAPLSDFVLSVVKLGTTSRRLTEEHVAGIFTLARGHAVAVNNVEPALQAVRPLSAAPKIPRLTDAFRRLR
jgi:tyrosine-protein kinase Etk/Wzc